MQLSKAVLYLTNNTIYPSIRSMKNYLAIVILNILFIPFTFAGTNKDTRTYKLIVKGDNVGLMTIHRWVDNDTTFYSYVSDATVNFFGKHHVVSHKTSKYYGGRMVYCLTVQHENNELKDSVELVWKGSYYQVHQNGDSFKQDKSVAVGTIAMFYQQPNSMVKEIFAEKKLDFQELTKVSAIKYEVDAGWGRTNTYEYTTTGKLKQLTIDSPMVKFELHLKE